MNILDTSALTRHISRGSTSTKFDLNLEYLLSLNSSNNTSNNTNTTTTKPIVTVPVTTTGPIQSSTSGLFSVGPFGLSWIDGRNSTSFSLRFNPSGSRRKRDVAVSGVSDVYIAFGFSVDQTMVLN